MAHYGPRYYVSSVCKGRGRGGSGAPVAYVVCDGLNDDAVVANGHFDFKVCGGWEVALQLANTLRDDLNAGVS